MGLFSRKKKDPDLEDLPPEAAAIVEQLRDVFPDAAISVDEPERGERQGHPRG